MFLWIFLTEARLAVRSVKTVTSVFGMENERSATESQTQAMKKGNVSARPASMTLITKSLPVLLSPRNV